MLAGPLVLGALLRLSAGQVTSYELGAWSEARGQVTSQNGVSTQVGVIEVDPRAMLQVEALSWKVSGGYAPRLWLPTDLGQLKVLHRANLLAAYRPDPLYLLTATATGFSGVYDLLAPAVAGPAGPSALPTDPIQPVGSRMHVRYLFGDLSAGLDTTPMRRMRVLLKATYVVNGGADDTARITLPLQRGPRIGLGLDWQLSNADRFDSAATISISAFTTSAVDPGTGAKVRMPDVWISTLTETWRRTFDSKFSTWVGGGAAVTGVAGVGGAGATVKLAFPVVDAGLQFVADDAVQRVRLSGRYGPLVDAITGRIYTRADSSILATWAPSQTWRLAGDLTAGLAIGGASGGQSIVTSQVFVGHVLSRTLDMSWGVRGLWQQPTSGSATASYRQWGLFVALAALHRDTF